MAIHTHRHMYQRVRRGCLQLGGEPQHTRQHCRQKRRWFAGQAAAIPGTSHSFSLREGPAQRPSPHEGCDTKRRCHQNPSGNPCSSRTHSSDSTYKERRGVSMKNGGTFFFPTKLSRPTFVLWGTSSSSCRWWNLSDSVSTLMATPSLPSPDDEPDASNHKRNHTQKHTHTHSKIMPQGSPSKQTQQNLPHWSAQHWPILSTTFKTDQCCGN